MKNVILLTIDTLRRDVLGCYGSNEGLSPFIDSIARDGLVFKNNYTVAPYTQHSFPGILTSSYIFDYPKSEQLSLERVIVASALKKHGFVSAGFHSNPYLSTYFGWNRGWEYYYDSMEDDVSPMNPYIKGNTINQKVDTWLVDNKDKINNKPFFLWVHYMDMHEPYIPDRKYIDKVDSSIQLSKEEMFKLFKEVVLPRKTEDKEKVEICHKLYKAQVPEIDDYARGLFDVLKKHNLLEDSAVIITTDHGDEFMDHGGLSHDGKFYEELVHCPLIVYRNGSREVENLTSGIDISPTIMSLFDLEKDPSYQGKSIFPLDKYPDKPAFGEALGKLSHRAKPTDKPAYFCFNKNHKVMYREENEKWELYDLANDPEEQNNVIESSPLAEEMKNILKTRIKRNLK